MFSGGIEMEHWDEMGSYIVRLILKTSILSGQIPADSQTNIQHNNLMLLFMTLDLYLPDGSLTLFTLHFSEFGEIIT